MKNGTQEKKDIDELERDFDELDALNLNSSIEEFLPTLKAKHFTYRTKNRVLEFLHWQKVLYKSRTGWTIYSKYVECRYFAFDFNRVKKIGSDTEPRYLQTHDLLLTPKGAEFVRDLWDRVLR